MDFFLGRVTREHEDIDLFVWTKDVPTLVHELERAGFVEQEGPPPEMQRDLSIGRAEPLARRGSGE
jgi:hypothetical protein